MYRWMLFWKRTKTATQIPNTMMIPSRTEHSRQCLHVESVSRGRPLDCPKSDNNQSVILQCTVAKQCHLSTAAVAVVVAEAAVVEGHSG
jgi:hypothetical protein